MRKFAWRLSGASVGWSVHGRIETFNLTGRELTLFVFFPCNYSWLWDFDDDAVGLGASFEAWLGPALYRHVAQASQQLWL